jgi:hypothetical protein
MTKALRQIDVQNRVDDIKAIQALKNRGITFITPSQNALVNWQKVADNASKKMIDSGILPRDVADQLDAHLASFHSKAPVTHDQ